MGVLVLKCTVTGAGVFVRESLPGWVGANFLICLHLLAPCLLKSLSKGKDRRYARPLNQGSSYASNVTACVFSPDAAPRNSR
jgi:hypothetical protein